MNKLCFDVHCTFKMINTQKIPFFSLTTDFHNQRIIITPPTKNKMNLEQFEKWITTQILFDYFPISISISNEKIFQLDQLVIQDVRKKSNPEETFVLFSKILDLFITKKRNYVFEIHSFCLIKRN